MERLTTDTPSNNEETLDNYAYVENSLVKLRYADGEEGIDLADYIARCARKKEPCRDVTAIDVLHGDACGMHMECDCELAVLNIVAIQAAELREQLKAYEDTGLAPEEINRAVSIQHWEDAYKELYERDLAELKKYRDAEEQGRLVNRPVDLYQWTRVEDGMPDEHDSIFAQFYGTPKWKKHMFMQLSNEVIIAGVYKDGLKFVTSGKTHDGIWDNPARTIQRTVTHWRPLPDLPKEGNDGTD